MQRISRVACVAGSIGMMLFLASAVPCFAEDEPVVDSSKTTQKLKSLPRKAGSKTIVTVYEVRSSVPEVQPKAATDMFTTALIKSGAFAVAERQRLNEGVMREKQINAAGLSTGTSGSSKIAGAGYIFEATISEANAGESQSGGGLSLGGAEISHAGAQDSIGMDVRIIDAESGLVLDAVNVRKKIEASSTGVGGLGKLAKSIFARRGKDIPLDPDVSARSSSKEGLDKAVRSCIEACVYELAKRFGED